jgi:NADPH:quinone reductase
MRADLWPAVEAGTLTLPIDRVFPLDQVVEAQAHMRANSHLGKIVLARIIHEGGRQAFASLG